MCRAELIYLKWNKSGFRPPLYTYRPNWARRTSWGWWDEWDDTVLQTQDSKFEHWRSEAEHATPWSRRLPTILSFTRRWGTGPRKAAWKAAVLTTTLRPPPDLSVFIWGVKSVVKHDLLHSDIQSHMSAVWENKALVQSGVSLQANTSFEKCCTDDLLQLEMMCKRCSFECGMGTYSTHPMTCEPFGEHLFVGQVLYFPSAHKFSRFCIFSHSQKD